VSTIRQVGLFVSRATLAVLFGVTSVEGVAGHVWLTIGATVPLGGGQFETPLVFSTYDAIVGAYEIRLLYDRTVVEILDISVPSVSPFFGNTFFDSESFASGSTRITAFLEQGTGSPTPDGEAAIVRWMATIGILDALARIDVIAETLVEGGWGPVEVETYGYDNLDTDGDGLGDVCDSDDDRADVDGNGVADALTNGRPPT